MEKTDKKQKKGSGFTLVAAILFTLLLIVEVLFFLERQMYGYSVHFVNHFTVPFLLLMSIGLFLDYFLNKKFRFAVIGGALGIFESLNSIFLAFYRSFQSIQWIKNEDELFDYWGQNLTQGMLAILAASLLFALLLLSCSRLVKSPKMRFLAFFPALFLFLTYISPAYFYIISFVLGVVFSLAYFFAAFGALTIKGEKKPSANEETATANGTNVKDGKLSVLTLIGLTIVTCGIYLYVWIYRTTRYLNRYRGEKQQDPMVQTLLCLFVPYYLIYWTCKNAGRIDGYAKEKGISSDLKVVCLILTFFFPIAAYALMQEKINTTVEGTALITVAPNYLDAWNCSQCHTRCTENFCPSCGAERPADGWTCPDCGARCTDKFCPTCGKARA